MLRNEDLFTVGGEIDEGVPWSGLQAVEGIGTGAELVRKDGTRRHLALGFLKPGVRSDAISRIVRHFEVFLLHGPLTLPGQANVEIQSGALTLRPVDRYDRDFCVSVELDPDRIEYQLAIRSTRELGEAVFDEALPVYRQQCAFWKYLIVVEGSSAGIVTVHLSDPILRHAQIGIDLVAAFQNRGIGSEALRVLIEFFRRETSLLKISAGCFADNHRCRRALEKAGMRLCGSQTRFWLKGREWKDGLLFECLLSDKDLPPST